MSKLELAPANYVQLGRIDNRGVTGRWHKPAELKGPASLPGLYG